MTTDEIRYAGLRDQPGHGWGYLNWLSRAYALPRMAAQMFEATRELQQLVRQPPVVTMSVPEGTGPLDRKVEGILPRMIHPSNVALFRQAVVADVETELLRLACAATRYHFDTGTYPPLPEALVPAYIPAIPIDPFDAQPLKMRAADGGLILWSVGTDQIDNHGARGTQNARWKSATETWDDQDITFYVGPAYTADVERFRQAWAAEHPAENAATDAAADPAQIPAEELKKLVDQRADEKPAK